MEGDLEVIHVAFGRWVDISSKALEHRSFLFRLNNALNQLRFILIAIFKMSELAFSQELATMFVCILYDIA